MADTAFDFSQLDPEVLSAYLKQKKAQSVLQSEPRIPEAPFVGPTQKMVAPPTFEPPQREAQMMPDLTPDDTSPKNLTGDLTPTVPDIKPQIPSTYDIGQQQLAERNAALKNAVRPIETPPVVQKAIDRTVTVPKEGEMDLHPSKTRRIMSVLGGIGAGFVGGVPGAMATYQQIRHPEYVSAMKNYIGQREADKTAADLAIREQLAQAGDVRAQATAQGVVQKGQLIPGQIEQNLASAAQKRAQATTYATPDQATANKIAVGQAAADAAAQDRARKVWEFTSPDGKSRIFAQQNPKNLKWFQVGHPEKEFIVPDDWDMNEKGRAPNAAATDSTPWKAFWNSVKAANPQWKTTPPTPQEVDKYRNEFVNSGVTSVAEANALSNRMRAEAQALGVSARVEKDFGGATPTQLIPGAARGQSAPVAAPPQAPGAPTVQPMTRTQAPAAKAPASAPKRVLSPVETQARSNAQQLVDNPRLFDKNKKAFGGLTERSLNEFTRISQLPRPSTPTEKLRVAEDFGIQSEKNAQQVLDIIKETPDLKNYIGAFAGRYEELVSGKWGDDLLANVPDKLKKQAQRLAVALHTLVASESAAANRGVPTDKMKTYIQEVAPKFKQSYPRFEGALQGVFDFAKSVKETAMQERFGGQWTPEASERLSKGMMHTNRDLFQAPDGKTYWKNILDEDTGQKWVATDKGYVKVKE